MKKRRRRGYQLSFGGSDLKNIEHRRKRESEPPTPILYAYAAPLSLSLSLLCLPFPFCKGIEHRDISLMTSPPLQQQLKGIRCCCFFDTLDVPPVVYKAQLVIKDVRSLHPSLSSVLHRPLSPLPSKTLSHLPSFTWYIILYWVFNQPKSFRFDFFFKKKKTFFLKSYHKKKRKIPPRVVLHFEGGGAFEYPVVLQLAIRRTQL
jgi:hypothetical protein